MTPISTVDLHLHTFYSDGRFSPEEVLRHTAYIGMKTIAITDHDHANGARHAVDLARQFELLVSGGSDSHGWGVGLNRTGSQPVRPEMVEALRARHEVLQSIIRSE